MRRGAGVRDGLRRGTPGRSAPTLGPATSPACARRRRWREPAGLRAPARSHTPCATASRARGRAHAGPPSGCGEAASAAAPPPAPARSSAPPCPLGQRRSISSRSIPRSRSARRDPLAAPPSSVALVLGEQAGVTRVVDVAQLAELGHRLARDRRRDALALEVRAHLARALAAVQVAVGQRERALERARGGSDVGHLGLARGAVRRPRDGARRAGLVGLTGSPITPRPCRVAGGSSRARSA